MIGLHHCHQMSELEYSSNLIATITYDLLHHHHQKVRQLARLTVALNKFGRVNMFGPGTTCRWESHWKNKVELKIGNLGVLLVFLLLLFVNGEKAPTLVWCSCICRWYRCSGPHTFANIYDRKNCSQYLPTGPKYFAGDCCQCHPHEGRVGHNARRPFWPGSWLFCFFDQVLEFVGIFLTRFTKALHHS